MQILLPKIARSKILKTKMNKNRVHNMGPPIFLPINKLLLPPPFANPANVSQNRISVRPSNIIFYNFYSLDSSFFNKRRNILIIFFWDQKLSRIDIPRIPSKMKPVNRFINFQRLTYSNRIIIPEIVTTKINMYKIFICF